MGGKQRAAHVIVVALAALIAAAVLPAAAASGAAPVPARPPAAQPRTPAPTPRRPTPTPTPAATPTPTLTPLPTAPPTPTPTALPCNTRVPQATRSGGFLQAAGVPGDATEAPHAGSVVLTSVTPASMLPPALGTVQLTDVTLVKPVDGSTPALVRAVAGATRFDCAQVEMGPSRDYLYATYVFHGAQFATYAPSGTQQTSEVLTLTYTTVDWEYQLRDGTPVATGSGALGTTPNPRATQADAVAQGPPLHMLFVPLAAGLLVAFFMGLLRWRRGRGTSG